MMLSKKAIVFLAITFAISWGATLGGVALGWNNSPLAGFVVMVAMMFGPAIAALTCALLYDKGAVREALGLKWTPNLWWIVAYLVGVVLCFGSVLVTTMFSANEWTDPAAATIALTVSQGGPDAAAQLRSIPMLGLLIAAQTFVLGALFNAVVLTFSEELGWRGYLHTQWRPVGFWKASLVTGAVWGVWHAPAIYFYGLNYPENREAGVAIFVLFCVLLSPVMALVRERGGSVIAAGIAHGAINAMAGYSLLALNFAPYPWSGAVGIGGFVTLAVLLLGVVWLRTGLAPKASQA